VAEGKKVGKGVQVAVGGNQTMVAVGEDPAVSTVGGLRGAWSTAGRQAEVKNRIPARDAAKSRLVSFVQKIESTGRFYSKMD
jgi:hypothetical protein